MDTMFICKDGRMKDVINDMCLYYNYEDSSENKYITVKIEFNQEMGIYDRG